MLAHKHPDCTGLWDQKLITGQLYGRCYRCGAIRYHSGATAEAAIQENVHGGVLVRLSEDGRKRLDK